MTTTTPDSIDPNYPQIPYEDMWGEPEPTLPPTPQAVTPEPDIQTPIEVLE